MKKVAAVVFGIAVISTLLALGNAQEDHNAELNEHLSKVDKVLNDARSIFQYFADVPRLGAKAVLRSVGPNDKRLDLPQELVHQTRRIVELEQGTAQLLHATARRLGEVLLRSIVLPSGNTTASPPAA